jgi:hypothetical protein
MFLKGITITYAMPICSPSSPGFLFSGKITEPLNIEDGMVNVKFNSNCIAVICPIRENAIKTWRLNHITSFGQSGGILTFECCSTCSDPGTSRCSINIIQEKSSIVLNLMEKAIRSNPNTGEIHYERSILGDIYHCDHECGQPQRLLPAFSDPNIYRSASVSPQKEVAVPIDINNEFEVPALGTQSSGKSNDSGFPDTPLPNHDVSSNTSSSPSPTDSAVKVSHVAKPRSSTVSIPSSITQSPAHVRSFSETAAQLKDDDVAHERRMTIDTEPAYSSKFGKLKYTDVLTSQSSPRRARFEDPVQYVTVQHDSPSRDSKSSRLERVDENDGIYDTPFEPGFWEAPEGGPFSPPGPSVSQRSSRSDSSTGQPITVRLTPSHVTPFSSGSDVRGDRVEEPNVPSRQRRANRPQAKETVKLFGGSEGNQQQGRGRSRLHSTGDVLDCMPDFRKNPRGSVDNLHQVGNGFIGRSDLLSKLHEQEEILSKFLARSRNEKNDEYGSAGKSDTLNKPYRIFEETDHEVDLDNYNRFASPTHPRSGRSSSSSDRGGMDRVLTKVASDTVRGYAYKIQIPLSDTVYDVPRRAAPAPNLANLRVDAPPKPQRYVAST